MSDTLLIKKYANRRLYDTERSHYITLGELAELVRTGRPVRIVDAKTEADLTKAVLMQVILEERGRLDMLPVDLLHQIIRVQGTVQQGPLAAFLETSYAQYSRPMADAAQTWMGAGAKMAEAFGFGVPARGAGPTPPPAPEPTSPEPESKAEMAAEVSALRDQMDALLKRLGQ